MDRVLVDPLYNFIIHTAPFGESVKEYYHWHLEIIPRVTKVAGFEWGTGFYINSTPPRGGGEVSEGGHSVRREMCRRSRQAALTRYGEECTVVQGLDGGTGRRKGLKIP
jgi:hypothetical protein